nr:DUF6234 family protein [Streptomyces sp. VB1]
MGGAHESRCHPLCHLPVTSRVTPYVTSRVTPYVTGAGQRSRSRAGVVKRLILHRPAAPCIWICIGQLHVEVSTRAHARHRPPRHPCWHDELLWGGGALAPLVASDTTGHGPRLRHPAVLLVTAWLVLDWVFGLGMDVWAAQGDQSQIDVAGLAHIRRTQVLLSSYSPWRFSQELIVPGGRWRHRCWRPSW